MTLAPWRSPLSRALHRDHSKPESRYFQLATVQANGYPANRTVVFRGFLNDTNQLKIITDNRSQKIDQIQQQSWAEACWYFTGTREQFRIAGKLILVDASCADVGLQMARVSTWQELSDNARIQFTWAHPGEKRANPEAFSAPAPDAIAPLANFCLLLLNPVKVDHLKLRGEPQNRYIYMRDEYIQDDFNQQLNDNWSCVEINP
ncbi:Npun_F5749 family FMN-dependent PPOX-type flavoprotein [Calothrix sp. UHCC 0171]|uniref:Npun_F5749 family FMN-dependent PPOX-type flavoprotein n=1 Tax=Calothrix sp. UHCC 0171 TaxID=3110245 RepID=UPI002B1E9A2C|nr:Npun_F5749 family FMN-dependent PPOX-type flavoprotein [Calothrix sp. UHCC 0171]MEA5572399.1 Npun_F5749 family FMN-dependent PPOX-type flavoprotein [Calothrix sp. UHCC 0171]